MRYLLRWFLWSIRWLLILILPVAGLLIGAWSVPEPRPLWEVNRRMRHTGGIIYDETGNYFFGKDRSYSLSVPNTSIVGINLKTGKELFTEVLKINSDMDVTLIPGTTTVLLVNRDSTRVFDWKLQQVVHLFPFSVPGYINEVVCSLDGNTIALACSDLRTSKIRILHIDADQDMYLADNYSDIVDDFGLSSTGRWLSVIDAGLRNKSTKKLHIIDTWKGIVVQTLSDEIQSIHWLPEEDAFQAVVRPRGTSGSFLQKYELNDQGHFVSRSSPRKISSQSCSADKQSPSRIIVVSTSTRFSASRRIAEMKLGKAWALLKPFWPDSTTFCFHDRVTGKLLKSMTINNDQLIFSEMHPDPSGNGFILESIDKLAYWEFPVFEPWYPVFGLLAGFTGSALLLYSRWRHLKRKRLQAA